MRAIPILLLALLLAACGASLQPPGNQPSTPALRDTAAVMPDGRLLPLRVWRTADTDSAVVIALHGFNDYSNAFAEPGAWWAGQGITVYAYDQRGFGATAYRGVWPGVPTLADDLDCMIRLVAAAHPGKPVYVVGESMGGAVAIVALTRPGAPRVDGLILAAPAVWGRATMNPVYRFALWLVPKLMPGQTLSGRGLNIQASDNIPMLRALGRDPLVIKETRADAVDGLADLMDAALAAAPALKTPALLLYGAKDQVIPQDPVEKMVATLSGPHRVAVYPEGWHLLFRDLDRQTVWRDAQVWMADRRAPLPSGAEHGAGPLFAAR